jgi:hypothetical protein
MVSRIVPRVAFDAETLPDHSILQVLIWPKCRIYAV